LACSLGTGQGELDRGEACPGGSARLLEVMRPVESSPAPVAGLGDYPEHQVPGGDRAVVAGDPPDGPLRAARSRSRSARPPRCSAAARTTRPSDAPLGTGAVITVP
jgi:hypothetical protein